MTSKDLRHGNNLYRACLSKVKYHTLKQAEEAAAKMTEKYGRPQYAYYCPYCFYYHLTTVPRKSNKYE